jgi:hypothetical protein
VRRRQETPDRLQAVSADAVHERPGNLTLTDEDDAYRKSGASPPNRRASARRSQGRRSEIASVPIRQYLYVEQLAELTPWSPGRIRNMISDGTFREGTHYYRPNGPGSRPIFSYRAVVEFIEGANQPDVRIEVAPTEVLDEDTRQARALLR